MSTQTNERRRDAGRTRLTVWLGPEAAAALTALTKRKDMSAKDAVEWLLLNQK